MDYATICSFLTYDYFILKAHSPETGRILFTASILQKWIWDCPRCSDTCKLSRAKPQNCVFALFPTHFWRKKMRQNFKKDHIEILWLIEMFYWCFPVKVRSSKGNNCKCTGWRAYIKCQMWEWYLISCLASDSSVILFTMVEYAMLCFSEYFNDIWKCQMDPSLWSKEILIYNTVRQQSSLLGKIMQNDTEIKFCLQWKHQSK